MAKQAEKKYIVSDQGYLLKDGKVYKTGEEISLTAEEFKNVENKVLAVDSSEGKALAKQNEEDTALNDNEDKDDK